MSSNNAVSYGYGLSDSKKLISVSSFSVNNVVVILNVAVIIISVIILLHMP